MHRVKNIFERVCSMRNLRLAAKEALRGKRTRPAGATFFMEMEKELPALHEELRDGTYAHGGYHYFWIHDPKDRLVAAAPFRDRVVHHAIVRVIEPIFENRFIEDSFACRRGKGTHAAMRRTLHFARRYRHALKCDVSKYFPSIDHEVLMGLAARVIGDGRVLGLLDRILDTHADAELRHWTLGGGLFDYETRRTGLPIGNLTSQFLANVYLNPLDHFVKHDLRVRGYVRYMDDFLLFGDDCGLLRKHGARIKDKLAELRLRMHPDKYRLTPTAKGVDFAGFVVFANGRVRIRSSSVRRFDRRYRRMLWEVNHKLRDPADLTIRVRAWGAHARHAQSYGLRADVLGRRRGSQRVTGRRQRVVSRLAGRVVQQQRQQPARVEPQQQQPDEREQQHRVPCLRSP
jgi:RNA-directed DNA polymerase